jgi:hypothetical protein
MKVPGLKRQRELRCWAIADVARAAGITWATAAVADGGHAISPATARKILAALEANPPSATAFHLVGEPSMDGIAGQRSA